MTMISKKDFISSNYRLLRLPAFTRAFFIKSSPPGELSYNKKKMAFLPSFKTYSVVYIVLSLLMSVQSCKLP